MFQCDKCNPPKSFTTKSNLNQHERNIHLPKPFVCELCEKTFARKDSSNNHKRKHVDVNKLQCPQQDCQKNFTTNANLKRHIKTCHEKTQVAVLNHGV